MQPLKILPLYLAVTKRLLKLDDADKRGYFTTINSKELFGDSVPAMSIKIPLELFKKFMKLGAINAVSYLYYNVEELFPSGFPGEENK